MKHKTIFLLLILFVSGAGCNHPPVTYAIKKDLVESIYAAGKIVPGDEHWISTQRSGTILKKLVYDGDTVQKGEVLYIISDEVADKKLEAAQANYNTISNNLSDRSPVLTDLQLAVHSADVKLKNDSSTYFRWKNLWEHGIGTKSNLDNVYNLYLISQNEKKVAEQRFNSRVNDLQTSLTNAQSQLASARKDVSDVYIRSDQDAVAYKSLREPGESVTANEMLVLLGHECDRIIKLNVDQEDITKVNLGQQVLLQIDTKENKIYEATVTFISPLMNESDQTFRVEAKFNQSPEQHFIYSTVEANIIIEKKDDVLVLPRTVLVAGDSLWIKKDGKQKKVPVQIGISTLEYVEVLSGIDEHTAVLTEWK